MLPDSLNSTDGYRVTGLQIRRHPDKDDQASKLKTELDDVVKAQASGRQFSILGSGMKLPFYLSVFVCPSSNS